MNVVSEFDFDEAEFQRILEESQLELDRKVNKSMEAK